MAYCGRAGTSASTTASTSPCSYYPQASSDSYPSYVNCNCTNSIPVGANFNTSGCTTTQQANACAAASPNSTPAPTNYCTTASYEYTNAPGSIAYAMLVGCAYATGSYGGAGAYFPPSNNGTYSTYTVYTS